MIPARPRHVRRLRRVRAMTRLSDYFFRVAVLAGLIGMGMGLFMGMTHDFSLTPAHAHLNLLGWASMAIYALFYRAIPAAAETVLARLHFFIAVPALVVMTVGIAMINTGQAYGEPVTVVGSIAVITGFALFAVIVMRATAARTATPPTSSL
jgi:hypothetical protein